MARYRGELELECETAIGRLLASSGRAEVLRRLADPRNQTLAQLEGKKGGRPGGRPKTSTFSREPS